MFNRKPTEIRILAPERTEYVTQEVHEHRAPTDASVKLLKEMEEAARKKVEQSIRLDGNGFECVVQIEFDAMSDEQVAVAVFSLNGKRMKAEARVGRRTTEDLNVALADKLRAEMAHKIATEILVPTYFDAIRRR